MWRDSINKEKKLKIESALTCIHDKVSSGAWSKKWETRSTYFICPLQNDAAPQVTRNHISDLSLQPKSHTTITPSYTHLRSMSLAMQSLLLVRSERQSDSHVVRVSDGHPDTVSIRIDAFGTQIKMRLGLP